MRHWEQGETELLVATWRLA